MLFNKNLIRQDKAQEHGPIKHLIHMIVCCGLPVIIIISLPFISRYSPALSGILGIIAPFICPVMMGGMMFMIFRNKDKNCCKEEKVINTDLSNNDRE